MNLLKPLPVLVALTLVASTSSLANAEPTRAAVLTVVDDEAPPAPPAATKPQPLNSVSLMFESIPGDLDVPAVPGVQYARTVLDGHVDVTIGLGALGFKPEAGLRLRGLTGVVSPYAVAKVAAGIVPGVNVTRILRAGLGVEYRRDRLGLYTEAGLQWESFCGGETPCHAFALQHTPQVTLGVAYRF